jgi:hypothetical protein
MLALARMPKWMEILEEETYEMKMHRFVRVCMMVAVVAILFGLYTSSSYGQETSTTDDSTAPANPPSTPNYVNAAKGYKIGGAIVLGHAARGSFNIALGVDALAHNTSGTNNTASGYQALYSNTTGVVNTAAGLNALYSNITGGNNTASGTDALFHSGGDRNTAVGSDACYNLATGSNVICIGFAAGPSGDVPGPATYIGGIYGEPTTGSGNPLVCVDSTGLLGTTGCAATDMFETLQRQNEELRQRVARLEALIEKK